MSETATQLQSSATAVAAFGDFCTLSDADLVAAQIPLATLRSQVDSISAALAGEIARRSARELGHSGLAHRNGFANATAMIEAGSGITGAEAAKLVAVGALLTEAPPAGPDTRSLDDAPPSAQPVTPDELSWRALVADAVRAAAISVDAASAISRGLSGIDDRVAATDLCAATTELIVRAGTVSPDRLFRAARAFRDRLDAVGIAERESERRQQRYFWIQQQPDGMYRGSFLLPPEDGTLLNAAIDAALSPRRGGPRFVDKARKAAAEKLLNDPRSNPQIAADSFTDLIRLAIDADPNTMVGSRRPAVRVTITETALHNRAGHGTLDSNPDPVSFETIERHICDTGIIGIKFDTNGHIINIGRTQRLYTERQRVGLEIRDHGCRFPNCDRPPAWCEAHHINQWKKEHGRTDLADGILLCRRHHMLIHNNHWKIIRHDNTYWLRPPTTVDPKQQLIAMPAQGDDGGDPQCGSRTQPATPSIG